MRRILTVSLVAALGWACNEVPTTTPEAFDAGFIWPDASAPLPDAGPDGPDVGFVRPDAGTPMPDAGAGPIACAPPLSIEPMAPTALPLGLITLIGAGGTGDYRFALVDDNSGALLNERSGAYLAGTTAGVVDRVAISDVGCTGSATISVTIVEPIRLSPTDVELAPGTALAFSAEAGSGQYSFTIARNESGGSVTAAGRYTAGTTAGVDVVRVRDRLTAEERDAQVRVVPGATLRPRPRRLFLPIRSTVEVTIDGGSGAFDLVSDDPSRAAVSGQRLEARAPGRVTVRATDRFTGQVATIDVHAIAAQTTTSTRAGDYLYGGDIASGDFNGDGFVDVALGWAEADVGAANSGAVYVYQGRPGGLDPVPAQIIAGVGRASEFGRDLVAADFDGDGATDLAIGAMRGDVGAVDSGALYIHRGITGGFFEDAPWRTLGGESRGDYFGFSVAACDFNGDGRVDLAVGAWLDEDRNRRTVSSNQGSVSVFLNTSGGFLDAPDVRVWGDSPVGDGTFVGEREMRFGGDLAAADFDGDGTCDLAASTHFYRRDTTAANDGLVYVYRGVADGPGGRGGITPFPVAGYAAGLEGERSTQFGRHIAAGDLDGDGRAELVISEYRGQHAPPARNNRGAFRVFAGGPLADSPITALTPSRDADLVYFGNSNGDEAGWRVAVADADGDGRNDIVSGNWLDEVTGGPGNVGTVAVFAGRPNALPELTPSQIFGGTRGGDRFGTFFAVPGDLDGDGTPDLVVMAALDDVNGRDVGAPWVLSGAAADDRYRLGLPYEPSGDQIARGMDIVGDLNGDGFDDLIVGAYLGDDFSRGVNSGNAWLYLGTARGFERDPAMSFAGFSRHSGGDGFGWRVARAGDFNGDGIDDAAIISRLEDKPNTWPATYVADETCGGTRNNSAAVFVFLGRRGGLPSATPAFALFGPDANDYMWSLAGGFDFNEDGFDDLVVGGSEWDRPGRGSSGGFLLLSGRAVPQAGVVNVICQPDLLIRGLNAGDQMGRSVSGAGDIDGDGCDEIVAGSYLEDFGNSNQGAIRIVFGWGPRCGARSPEALTLRSDLRNAQAGYAVGGGADVDGDSVPDVIVGGVGVSNGRDTAGGVWLLSGSYLASLEREPIVDDVPPTRVHIFADQVNNTTHRILGVYAGERFGSSIALVPGLSTGGRAAVIVGGPNGGYGGVDLAGGAAIYEFDTRPASRGFGADPTVIIVGETDRPGGLLGDEVRGGLTRDGRPTALVGGYLSSGAGLDVGAAYVVELQP